MNKGGYLGGSSIIRIGRDGTYWSGEPNDRSVVKKRKAKKAQAQKPKAAPVLKDTPEAARQRRVQAFLTELARHRALKKPDPPVPNKLSKEVEAAGGLVPWVRGDSKRLQFFLQATETIKDRTKPPSEANLTTMTTGWIVCVKHSRVAGNAEPGPPRAIRPAIDAAGGVDAFIRQFESKHGPVEAKAKGKKKAVEGLPQNQTVKARQVELEAAARKALRQAVAHIQSADSTGTPGPALLGVTSAIDILEQARKHLQDAAHIAERLKSETA